MAGEGWHGDGRHHPEGCKEGDCSAWGRSLRLSPGQAALLRQRGYADLPALGTTAAFVEPHEELIRWRSRDKCRYLQRELLQHTPRQLWPQMPQ